MRKASCLWPFGVERSDGPNNNNNLSSEKGNANTPQLILSLSPGDLVFIKDATAVSEIQKITQQINAIPKAKRAMPENTPSGNDELFFAYTLVDLTKIFFQLQCKLLHIINGLECLPLPLLEKQKNNTIKKIQTPLETITKEIQFRLCQLVVDVGSTSPPVEEPSLFTSIEENGKTALAVLQENHFLSNPPIIIFPDGTVTVLDPPQEFSLLKPSTWFTNWGKRRCEFAKKFNEICVSISLPSDLSFNELTLQKTLNKIEQISSCFQNTNNQLAELEKLCTQYKPSRLRTLFGLLSGAKNTRHLIESCETAVKKTQKTIKTSQVEITKKCTNLFVEKLGQCFDKKLNGLILIPNEANLNDLCVFCNQHMAQEQKAEINLIIKLLKGEITSVSQDKWKKLKEEWIDPHPHFSILFQTALTCPAQISNIFTNEEQKKYREDKTRAIMLAFQNAQFDNTKRTLETNSPEKYRSEPLVRNINIITEYKFEDWEWLFKFFNKYSEPNICSEFSEHYHMTRALYFFNEIFLSNSDDEKIKKNQCEMIGALKHIQGKIRLVTVIKTKAKVLLEADNTQENQARLLSSLITEVIKLSSSTQQNTQLLDIDNALVLYFNGFPRNGQGKTPQKILDESLQQFKESKFPTTKEEQEKTTSLNEVAYRFVQHYDNGTFYKNQYKQILLCIMINNNADVDRKNFAIQLLKQFGFNFEIDSQQAFWSELMSCSLLELNKINIIPGNIKACIDSAITVYPNDEQLRKQHLILEFLKKGLIQEASYVLQALAIHKLEDKIFTDIQEHLQNVLKVDAAQLKPTDIKSLVNAILSAEPASVFHEMIKDIENGTEKPANAPTFLTEKIMDNMNFFISSCFSNKSNNCTPWHYRQSLLQNTNNEISNDSLEFVRDDNDTVRRNNTPLSIRYNYVLFLKTTADVLMCTIKNPNDQTKTINQVYCFMKKTLQETRGQYERNNENRGPEKNIFLKAMDTAINTLEKNINNRAGTPISSGSNNTSPTGTPTNDSNNSSLASTKPVVAEQPSSASVVGLHSFLGSITSKVSSVAQNLSNPVTSLLNYWK